jgi:general secretion pathway protein E
MITNPIASRLEQVLEEEGLMVRDKFDEWLQLAGQTGQTLDRILTGSGYLTETQMLEVFGKCLGMPVMEKLQEAEVPETFVDRVPVHFARYHNLVGVGRANGTMQIASCSPLEVHPMDELAAMLDMVVEPVLAPRAEITALVNKAYQSKIDVVDEMLEDLEEDDLVSIADEIGRSQDLLDIANKAPIIKLVNMILFQALKMRSSDIHIQPYEEKLQIRYRVDGILYDMMTPPKKLQEAIVSRIKIMGKMDIAERRLPQDGRAGIRVGDSEVDIRISSVPTSHGERIVMRILDKSARLYELSELGLDEENIRHFHHFIRSTHGIILVTGPTGSGKTTTLYAALQEVNSVEKNILTIEDPIEYHLSGISQIEVASKKGLTFAAGLRSIVRQDPDIIFVGEIRDLETATIAIQSALTGHLVYSTLHTNDAPSAATRLLNLGVEPYLVASSLVGVVAQRLVRVICSKCRVQYTPTDEELASVDLTREQIGSDGLLYKGEGCPNCFNTGYIGRTAIHEILRVTDHVRDQIMNRVGSNTIKFDAIASGMRTLRMAGSLKVLSGQTTIEEVMRVTQMDMV